MAAPETPASRRGKWHIIGRLLLWGMAATAVMLVALAAYLSVMLRAAPSANELKRAEAARASVLLSADGQPLATEPCERLAPRCNPAVLGFG